MQRKFTRRQLLKGAAVGLGSVSAGILAACAAPPASAPSAPAAPATEATSAPAASSVTLRLQAPAVPLGGMAIEFAKRFQDDTGIKVEVEETIYGEIEKKTQTGFISDTLQDVVYGHHRWLFINFTKGIYAVLDDMFKSDPPPDFADIFPSVMEGNKFEGKNFSLPDVVHPGGNIVVSYNKTLLAEKGLEEPKAGWTLADWEALARKAADPEKGIFGMSFDNITAMHYYSNIARSFGEKNSTDMWLMDREGKTFQYNTPMHKEIASWFVSLHNDKIAPRKKDQIETGLFVGGLSATHSGIVGSVADFLKKTAGKFEMDAVLLPVGDKGRQGTCYSGNQWMINAKTKHMPEAYKLLNMLTSKDAGVYLATDVAVQPNGRKSAWTDPAVNQINRMFGVAAGLIEAGVEPFPMPYNTRFTEANTAFQAEIEQIWEGTVTWDEHAPVIQKKLQDILDQPRP
ncbi:MAG: extracellular solute-binding protein [Candidatus Brachytrichaceae bacterium NZ_4S206]|jgi:ABC-type glycerol-3-phosphate transport system substrate-binding protein